MDERCLVLQIILSPLAQLRQNGYNGRDIRFVKGTHYRKPINYSEKALKTAKNTVKKIDSFHSRLGAGHPDAADLTQVDQLIYSY